MKKQPVPRVFICIDNGMVWEACGDTEIMLIVKNLDRQWIRYLPVHKDVEFIDKEEEILKEMKLMKFKPADLRTEELLHKKQKGS